VKEFLEGNFQPSSFANRDNNDIAKTITSTQGKTVTSNHNSSDNDLQEKSVSCNM
jgi:hypothetical protein